MARIRCGLFLCSIRENYISYYGENTKIKGEIIMLNKLKKRINNLKERINERKRPLTDEEIYNYVGSLTKEEKQMYARLYRGN